MKCLLLLNARRKTILRSGGLLLLMGLSACGFQLRGAAHLPFTTIYLSGAENSTLTNELRRTLRASSDVNFVKTPQEAEAILELTGEQRTKDVLSFNAQGRAREYTLIYSIGLRVHDGKGHDYLKPATLRQTREITFNDGEVLAKENEEALLYRDMQSDLVQQVLRRMSNIKKTTPTFDTPTKAAPPAR